VLLLRCNWDLVHIHDVIALFGQILVFRDFSPDLFLTGAGLALEHDDLRSQCGILHVYGGEGDHPVVELAYGPAA
jgi:hypothetical protein